MWRGASVSLGAGRCQSEGESRKRSGSETRKAMQKWEPRTRRRLHRACWVSPPDNSAGAGAAEATGSGGREGPTHHKQSPKWGKVRTGSLDRQGVDCGQEEGQSQNFAGSF